jgi:hypothetical protein
LTEADSSRGADSDCESRSDNSGDSKTAFNNSGHPKVEAAAALAGITYDFGPSVVTKGCVTSMESYTHFSQRIWLSPWRRVSARSHSCGYFAAGLRMPSHLILVDIMCKFWVQLHHLMPNAIVQIGMFIWAITSCKGLPTIDVFAQHYKLHY